MQHPEKWTQTKFAFRNGEWRPSPLAGELAPASVVSASLALRSAVTALRAFACGHLADLGCGKVPYYGVYRDLVIEVTCVDWPGTRHAAAHIDVYLDLNDPIPLADGAFDTIFCSSVLEHIWKHETMWHEMARTMRPGGHLILTVPFIYALHEVPHDFFRWTRFALERACLENELEVIYLEPYGGGIDVLADLTVRALDAVWPWLAGVVGRAAALLLKHGIARRLSPRAFEALPLGYTLVARKGG
jgi:SAM-dependent methyltransferase